MKIFSLSLLLLPLLAASMEHDGDRNSTNITANVSDIEEDFQNETLNAVFQELQWDIDAPKYSVRKAAGRRVQRGKVLAKLVLTRQMKSAIIWAHNRARSTTTPSASNMLRMTWDNDLANTATAYTRKCIYEHNPNPTHKRFDYLGENLFISMGLPYNKKLLDHAVRAWDAEKTVYNYYKSTCKKGKMCGHYTQVVWAETFKLGCGVTRCGNINVRGRKWKNAILFGCNYGPGGNYVGEKPYERGIKCKNCPRSDRCTGKLCANSIRDRLVFNPRLSKWSPWSPWSPCSVSCGMGNMRRKRDCNTRGQSDCKGSRGEVKFCTKKPCQSVAPPKFNFDVVLSSGDKFDANSFLTLFANNKDIFRRSR